jgi:ABC-type glycerol-3-phosphate transport system substrate-binding protein
VVRRQRTEEQVVKINGMGPAGRLRAIGVAAAIVLGTAGCGGSSSSSAAKSPEQEWTGKVCGSLTTWKTDLAARTNTLVTDLQAASLTAKPAVVTTAVADFKVITDTAVNGLKGAGKPPGADAAQLMDGIGATLQASGGQLQTSLLDLNTRPADDVRAVTRTAATGIETALAPYAALSQAWKDTPDCVALTGG